MQAGSINADPGPTWRIKGTGDFYGDGQSDILWQNDNDMVIIWKMDGSTITNSMAVATNPDPTWHINGTGDFNNDGKTDIVWQNDDGTVAVWLMDGNSILTGGQVSSNPGQS